MNSVMLAEERIAKKKISIAWAKLLKALDAKKTTGDTKVDVTGIKYDSRQVAHGDVFVAISGYKTDGHSFIPEAVKKGAVVVISQKEGDFSPARSVIVPDTRLALAQLAREFYGHPSSKLSVIGVTGTNGKTTITHWLKSILEKAGTKTGVIGTVKYQIGQREIPAARTTPESVDLQALFAEMLDQKVKAVAMEVSSHALELKRVEGIDFKIGVFTNLTREHLDFHQTMEKYQKAKGILFSSLKSDDFAILNADDPASRNYAQITTAKKSFYSLSDRKAQVCVKSSAFSPTGTQVVFVTPRGEEKYNLKLTGDFNLSNLAAVLAACVALGLTYEQIRPGAESFTGAPGRMEKVDLGQDFYIWIDYAHTPDGMERVLKTVKSFSSGRLICLFGCGGERDRGKRAQMGKIAKELADFVVLTSDNPRGEDPKQIVDEILSGIKDQSKVRVILDRQEALEHAVSLAGPQDCLIVTGKGHESYQEIMGIKYPFSERNIIEAKLGKLGYGKK